MKNWIIINLLLLVFSSSSTAQDLPPCIKSLNKTTSLSNTTFEKVVYLKGNRKVYQFAIKSVPQCLDCHNGTVFYDENCNEIASFLKGRGARAYIDYGYTAEELGKAGYPDIKLGVKKDPVSNCIEKLLSNTDSLERTGVSRIVQVRMKGKVLYGFERRVDPKLANCKDCSTAIVYYNADCKPEVTFRVGGIAGIKGDNGYTASDFTSKTTLKIVWNSKVVKNDLNHKPNNDLKLPDLHRTYVVDKNLLPDFKVFKLGDKIIVSSRDGLKHIRKGQHLDTYKIIPLTYIAQTNSASKPNAALSKQSQIFYIEPFKRYFKIVDKSFMVTKAKYLQTNALKSTNKVEWMVALELR